MAAAAELGDGGEQLLVGAGDPAVVEVDAFPGERFNGRIARVSPILDPATRTAPMEVEIPNREFRLKPGMYATIAFEQGAKRESVLVPSEAVIRTGTRDVVIVGGGHNGLVTSFYLARAGRRPLVLERRPVAGGGDDGIAILSKAPTDESSRATTTATACRITISTGIRGELSPSKAPTGSGERRRSICCGNGSRCKATVWSRRAGRAPR